MKFIALKMGLIAGLALSVHGCSGDQQQEEAIENTEGENEAGGNQAAEGSGSGEEENEEGNAPAEGGEDGEGGEADGEDATGDESAEGGEAPATDAATDAPATEAPAADATAAAAPTGAPADAPAAGGAAPAAAAPEGGGVDPNRVVRFVVADGTAIKSAANDTAGAAGTFSQGDIVMVVIEGEWAKLNDQAFVKLSDLSEKAVPRMKGKTASWSAAGG